MLRLQQYKAVYSSRFQLGMKNYFDAILSK